jgi:uncharacterized protein YegL
MKNKTEIVLIVDRSGSMSSIRADVEGGLNTFIEKQKELPGECKVTYVRFDTETETVFENTDIKTVGKVTIDPRGSTALLDALGQTINKVGQRLANIPESERPEQILVYLCSDGEENASHEYTHAQVKEMIEHQQSKYNWKFTFLGCANFNAVSQGASFGVASSSTMNFSTSSAGVKAAFCAVNNATSFYRSAVDNKTSYVFTEEELKAAQDNK